MVLYSEDEAFIMRQYPTEVTGGDSEDILALNVLQLGRGGSLL